MKLTEGLASVAAQTLPVLAFAATVEILTIYRSYNAELRFLRAFVSRHSTRWGARIALALAVARWILVLFYIALIIYSIRAEWLCLRVLGGDQSLAAFGKDVENAVLAAFAAVVLIPVTPAILRMQSLRTIKRDIGLKPPAESRSSTATAK